MAIELREYQRDCLDAVRRDWRNGLKRCLVSMPTGCGKCVRPDTYVWHGGLRRFGDLRSGGDSHIRAPWGVERIMGWHDDGERPGLKLTTDCGLEIDGTSAHRLWVRTLEGFEGWRPLGELAGDEYVAVARGLADWGHTEIDTNDAFLLGLLVADGCDRKREVSDELRVDKHPLVLQAVAPIMRKWATKAGCSSTKPPTLHMESEQHAYVCVSAKGLVGWLHDTFGLVLGPSENRLVPAPVLRAMRRSVVSFVQGLFAGDGDAEGAVELTSTSLGLLGQVQQLLLGLGVWSGVRPRKSEGLPAWRLTVRDLAAFDEYIAQGILSPPGTVKQRNYSRLIAKKRNCNADVVPGMGKLIRDMGATVERKWKRQDAWKHADAYYSGEKKPSYETLSQLIRGAPPSEHREACARIARAHYAWSPIKSIETSTAHRIDCEVERQHSFVGNGLVNHNTWVYVFSIWGARSNGLRSLVLENTDELIEQSVEKLRRVGVNPGIIKGTKNEWTRDVVVASVQTLSKASRLYNLPPNHFGLVITDEAHYANAPSYQRVLWYFADAWHLGVTATPFRGDKRSLAGAGWNVVSYVYTLQQAIREKWLAPVRFERVDTGLELRGLGHAKPTLTSERDFNLKALAKVINTPERNQRIVDAALRHLLVQTGPYTHRMRRAIAFCADVNHSVDLANAFRQRGIETFAIYGSMKESHRRKVLLGHRQGGFPILTNCNILTHGYDDPGLEAVIMARPTESKVLYLQEIGRGMRLSPETGKQDCVVLDVVDVAKKHALTIGKELIALEEAMDEQGSGKPSVPPQAPTEIPGLLRPPVSDHEVPELVPQPEAT